jgi:hypothetical protein
LHDVDNENPTEKPKKKALPPHLTPGNPGNSGGKPGRSGRKPDAFVEWCDSVLSDPTVQAVAHARAKSGDMKVLEFCAKYSKAVPGGGAEATIETPDGAKFTLTIGEVTGG